MKKQSKNNCSQILHIGERNIELLDMAMEKHDDIKCVHIKDHMKLYPFLQEVVPDLLIIEYSTKLEDFISYLSLVQRSCSTPIIITAQCSKCNIMVQAIKNGLTHMSKSLFIVETAEFV